MLYNQSKALSVECEQHERPARTNRGRPRTRAWNQVQDLVAAVKEALNRKDVVVFAELHVHGHGQTVLLSAPPFLRTWTYYADVGQKAMQRVT